MNLVQHNKRHSCRRPGPLCRQDISNHDIYGLCKIVKSCVTRGRISTIYGMWECKYMFMFPLKDSARKGLTHGLRFSVFWCCLILVRFTQTLHWLCDYRVIVPVPTKQMWMTLLNKAHNSADHNNALCMFYGIYTVLEIIRKHKRHQSYILHC